MVKDWSKPLQTKDGRKARLLGVINSSDEENRVVAIMDSNGIEQIGLRLEDGRSRYASSAHDIINAPEKRIDREHWRCMRNNCWAMTYYQPPTAEQIAENGYDAILYNPAREYEVGEGMK